MANGFYKATLSVHASDHQFHIDFIVEDVRQKLEAVEGISKVNVQLVFEPEWNKDMMSEEAKMELGFL